MTHIKADSLPFRPCVGILLFNKQGQVFVGERLDNPGAWQMPQGGIDEGETQEQAAMRELLEETGTDKAEIIRFSPEKTNYTLPDHLLGKLWNGKYRGQEQSWVAMRFLGDDSDITLYHTVHPEFSKWQWMDLDKVPEVIVPFKRETYLKVIQAFHDIPETIRNI